MGNDENHQSSQQMTRMIPPTVFQTRKVYGIKRKRRIWNMMLKDEMIEENSMISETTSTITSPQTLWKTSQENERTTYALKDNDNENGNDNGKKCMANICLLCRQEFDEEYCWHCNGCHIEQHTKHQHQIKQSLQQKYQHQLQQQYQEKKLIKFLNEEILNGKFFMLYGTRNPIENFEFICNNVDSISSYRRTSTIFMSNNKDWQQSSRPKSRLLDWFEFGYTLTTIMFLLKKYNILSSMAFNEQLATLRVQSMEMLMDNATPTVTATATEQHHVQLQVESLKTGTNDKTKICITKTTTPTTTSATTKVKSADNNYNNKLENINKNKNNSKNINNIIHHSDDNETTKTTKTSYIRNVAQSALRTFSFIIFYIHMQCPFFNNHNKHKNHNHSPNYNNNNNNNNSKYNKYIKNYFTLNNPNNNKNNNNNSVHYKINNFYKSNKRQQRPPKQRLNNRNKNQQCTSFVDKLYNNFINSSFRYLNTSLKNQQQQQQQKPQHQQHHNVQMQQKEQEQNFGQQQYSHHHQRQQHQYQYQYQQQQKQKLQQCQITQLRYYKMPNLSLLYKILIVLSFLSIFLPSTTQATHQQQLPPLSLPTFSSLSLTAASSALVKSASASASSSSSSSSLSSSSLGLSSKITAPMTTSRTTQVRLGRNETVCKSLDLRNTPSEFRQLENCTVIEGFLVMTLVNTHSNNEFTESYPLLTEVTDFIVVYRVHNLRSLSQIFPNLSIIRGGVLHEGYALVVYSNPHLEDLGLSKLMTIQRGGVRIENNLWLCYVETIDWSLIVTNTTDIVIQNNRASIECPLCPKDPKAVRQDADSTAEGDAICKEYDGKRHCWNSKMCQKICPKRCPHNCIDENTCCNEACISGCSPNNLSVCTSCRHFSIYNNTCIDKCPPNYYNFLDRRCTTAEACTRMGTKYENNKQETLVAFNGTCSTRCPIGYIKEGSWCIECGNKCTKKCEGGVIDSVSAAKGLHGCTHIIKEGLTISIKRGGRHLMEDLEFGLSSIQVIDAFLKVHLTFGMFSLEFFKNLHTIKGETLCEDKFALYVLENNDLESIWGPNQTVNILNGRVFFHFNPKLCYSTIDALRSMMKNNAKFDKNEVALDSNGNKGSCNPEYLNTTVVSTSASNARIKIVNPLRFDDERTFIGYQYFYMEDRYRNATKHRHRPCDDSWFVSEPTKEIDFIIPSLTPFTQYAYYIKTMTISSEPRNAQSPIQYFKTKSSQPNSVRKLEAYANSSSEIILKWLPPLHVYGNLSKYKVRAKLDLRNQKSSKRNYCKDPVKGSSKFDTSTNYKPSTEKPVDITDCNCYSNREKDNNLYDNEAAEANRHDVIDFENALQNFIYVKHQNSSSSDFLSEKKKENSTKGYPRITDKKRNRRSYEADDIDGESFLVRHMRALPPKNINDRINISTTTELPTENTTMLLFNTTRMDPEGLYYEVIIDSVNASTTEYVFRRLKHFAVYMLEVEACREPEVGAKDKECSEVLSTYVRTLKMDNVDKVKNLKATLEPSNTTRTNVRLSWDAPERPNGAIVSYTILYTVQAKDAAEGSKCITEEDYRNMSNGYLLTDLQMGSNYSIKVCANSLADEGDESEAIFIQTPKPGIPLWLLIILIIILILCLIGGAFGLYCYKKRKNTPPSDLRFYPSVNPYYMSLHYEPDSWEVSRERVIQLNPLGQGSFGMVYEGILKGLNSSTEDTPCAIKTVNENATDRERLNFLNEAGVMKQFDTYHVVKLLGVCSQGQPALVVMELMKNGDLKSYLRAHRPYDRDDEGPATVIPDIAVKTQPPPLSRIYQMAIEIADGMAYLAAKKFVHRDLAARNCMVAADLTVKIGDFGMTRDIYETDYYRKGTKGLLPVRWMPPEALHDGVYSSASDVFSYGVVLWEMATLAAQPYQGLSNDQVLRYVIDGGVMERPENCPDDLYDLMQRCWMHRPTARPTFMEIITILLSKANKQFADVSFYHSEAGQQVLVKERVELQHSGDVFHDHDHDLDDATTPLRRGEFNEFPLNMDPNLSVENNGDSPMVIEDHPHSPYSIGSANIVSSTPDGQSKHSLTASQNNPILSSAPSTSAGVISGSVGGAPAHSYPRQVLGRYQSNNRRIMAPSAEDDSAYVQPDQEIIDEIMQREKEGANAPTSRSVETNERGYEVFDPSLNFREHITYDPPDDEEDFEDGSTGRGSKLSGGQNLLPRQKSRQRVPTIMPMSSSMPDEAISAPMSSSAASSNASSNATATAGSAKYPTSLKRAVAETMQNVGNSLMPTRLRNINRRFLGHKRTGSNTSHKSTSSNPTSTNSNTNLTMATAPTAFKSQSGQNLGTIESGGSGGSYTATPRFFTPSYGGASSATPPPVAIMSDNPNYQLLDETANVSAFSGAGGDATNTPMHKNNTAAVVASKPSGFITSTNPNYQLLDESLNTTGTRPLFSSLSENPNYASHEPPTNTTSTITTPYVMMNEPQPPSQQETKTAPKFSDNPNYQMMGPPTYQPPVTQAPSTFSYPFPGPSSSDEDDPDNADDDAHTEHIKMERMPLSRRAPQKQHQQQQQQQQKKRGYSRSRSRSKSRTKSIERTKPTVETTTTTTPATTTTTSTTTAQQTKPSQTFSLKEKWLRQHQPPPPPPNGFIGREG